MLTSNPSHEVSKERQTVRTTWQLNFEYIKKQSYAEDLGSTAVSVMEVLAYLYADEIPIAVINTGSPMVTDKDLLDGLEESLGVRQSVEVLTRFSLFQWTSCDTISVHRLVQEIIRENISDPGHKIKILNVATRMINKALENTHTISEVLESKNALRMSLQTWNKIALHAGTLKEHIFEFTRSNSEFNSVCFNVETCYILQASAIYHSLFQQQEEALACQEQMLSIIVAVDISVKDYQRLTCIKIPLLSTQRVIIQGCVATAFGSVSASEASGEERTVQLLDSEALKQKGNTYFNKKQFNESVQCYSEALSIRNENMDPFILSNRSLAYIKIGDYENALRDAKTCIELNPTAWKSYCWKAYAIANLIRLGQLSESWKSVGLASAAVAVHMNEQCSFEKRMKNNYPSVRDSYKTVKDLQLENECTTLRQHHMPYKTLLLPKGCYKLCNTYIITTSVQIVGIEDGVEIHCYFVLELSKSQKCCSKDEDKMNIHFENVCLPTGSEQIKVGKNVSVTFYRCKFSNGKKGCSNFPLCEGDSGCVSEDRNECRMKGLRKEQRNKRANSGKPGYYGISAVDGGNVFVEKCVFDRCGGGGLVCEDEGSLITILNSVIKNMIQNGVEARHGGKVKVENCAILDNQFHGVAIGPSGYGRVKNCTIQGNKEEGIWCGDTYITDAVHSGKPGGGSICEIEDTIICQNGMCGIALNGGSFDISGNKVFENWLWGILLQSRSTVYISNNDIFENKCGGIRTGMNYSSPVVLNGNSVRDHSGPGLHIHILERSSISQDLTCPKCLPYDERVSYSIYPIFTNRNVLKENSNGLQHPRQIHALIQTCCYCHTVSVNLKLCTKCRKASYCSKQCQRSHWKRHKYFCRSLHDTYTIELDLSETEVPEQVIRPLTPAELAAEQRQGESCDITGKKKFIVKIESGAEYSRYNPDKQMQMYDQTRSFGIWFKNPQLYHLVCECGVLGHTLFTTKKIYCWALFKSRGKKLCIYTIQRTCHLCRNGKRQTRNAVICTLLI